MISYDITYDILNTYVVALHCRSVLSTAPFAEPSADQNILCWSRFLTQVTKSLRFFWRHFGWVCSSSVLVSLLRDWTNSMTYQWKCL